MTAYGIKDMKMDIFRNRIEKLLNQADVRVNGDRPWDITVHHCKLFKRLALQGSLGLGESYMEGWWDCAAIDQLVCELLKAEINRQVPTLGTCLASIGARLINPQKPERSLLAGRHHYDIGNDLFERMLDSRMTYSCAYWKDAETLEAAQEQKLDLVCRKLHLKPGMRLLDIGCGWGGLARFAAERYGVEVVGVTISREQLSLAKERCRELPVEIRLQDYRHINERFDRIVSVGMFEHVGYKNYRAFMAVADRCLNQGGLFLLHTIGGNKSVTTTEPWIKRYIFPIGMIPSAVQITSAFEGLFMLEDWHDFGHYYDRTLMAWWRRFEDAWPDLSGKYGERFHRMWRYYLLSCAGAFRARFNQLWQIVLTKAGSGEHYEPVR
jgi:cyclopropane-fatty-acyl-phospholipid synthase